MQATSKQLQQQAGAFILADLTKKPPFLIRNIEQRFPCEKDKRQKPKVARLDRTQFDLRAAVHFTTMNERLSPTLRVSVNGVSPTGRRVSSGSPQGQIRARGNVIDVRCRLRIEVHSLREAGPCLYQTHRIATLRGERQQDGKFYLTLSLSPGEKPFEFQMDQLKDIVENEITWREGMAENYSMRFSIIVMRISSRRSVENIFSPVLLHVM